MKTKQQQLASERITFRCTPELKNRIESEAAADRRKPSQWIITQLEDLLEQQTQTSKVAEDATEYKFTQKPENR